jgi:dipeptidyl aminopeptidase/acylaminoacyl peptidase
MFRWALLLTLAVLILASGCADQTAIPQPVEVSKTALSPTPTSTRTPDPTETATRTITPSRTFTYTPSPTATPIPHPMEIEAMRRGSYPGSQIVIEKELERGANYRRYYAWYLSEGLKIYGLLTIPLVQMPVGGYPALVFLHGYIAPAEYRTTERYLAYTDWLSRNGYVVYKIDLRGHDRSEGIAQGAYSTPGYTVDVLNAVASLQQNPQVNPEKIGMWGHSMGGFLTLRAMVILKQIKVGVIWAGLVCNYADMFYRWRPVTASSTPSPTFRGWRADWIQQYGMPEEAPDFWNSISANSFLTDLSGPLQLHHGTADTNVPLVFSEELASDVEKAGGTVELYTYEGDNHNLSNSFIVAMTRTVKFFDEYLK